MKQRISGEGALIGEASAPSKGITKFMRNHKDAVIATIILGPMLLWWALISGFPTLFGFFLGFFEWVGVASTPKFIGFDNYVRFFNDPVYYMALWRAVWIGLLVTGLTIIIGFLVALLMNLPLFGKGIYRTMWYIPVVTSTVATTQIFNIFLDPNNGVINNILKGFGKEPIIWQYSVGWGVFWIVVYSIWKGIGGSALIWLAGLQSVDPVLYEAADIDGANRWQKFWNVTLPGVKPIATYIIITGLIGAVQIYEQVIFITGGGPYGQTEVLVYRILRDGFFDFNLGMAGASSVVLAAVVFVFTVAYFRYATENERSSRKKNARGAHGG
ncbi:carbohydrate ABC transporter permease [Paenibacillus spongiae]|uniref:Sugar ABC transporter permease n=1 Tax=Paenibacillus spongiae TaxID=2909671 RepID=A0ABY5S4F1_9BACL|nr:sugar ABC transporter permease [Paenibacillus spongiae]UVI28772.1 sugar ABC transporter permease [Paenibacillus spongiae]